jgi:hypothetical protein
LHQLSLHHVSVSRGNLVLQKRSADVLTGAQPKVRALQRPQELEPRQCLADAVAQVWAQVVIGLMYALLPLGWSRLSLRFADAVVVVWVQVVLIVLMYASLSLDWLRLSLRRVNVEAVMLACALQQLDLLTPW